MVGAGVEFAFAARANDVARAMLIVAKKRIAPSVSSFNVVVELGQIAFNTVLLSVIALVRRIPLRLPRWPN